MDASHLIFGIYLSYIWCYEKIYLPSPSGRERLSVLGAMDAVTKEVICVYEDKYVSAITVCEMLRKLAEKSTDGIPVTVFLDNAKYQKCKAVTSLAVELNIELAYLPTYSPNLNLIERYWDFLRENVLDSETFTSYANFKSTIKNFNSIAHEKYKFELNSLMSWNFQILKKTQ